MKIAIFGATGLTGMEAVKQALAANHSVTAIVRNPSKMKLQHENLKVEEGNIFDEKTLTEKIAGHDAVLSCLGFQPEKPKVTGYLDATKSICAAMEASGLKRLVLCHSWYTDEASRANGNFFLRWVLFPMIKTVLDNMRETELWLDAESKLDFTVVRPPGLTNGAVTDKELKVGVGVFEISGAGSRIPRADVARFMLSCLNTDEYNRKHVAIAA